MRPQISLFSQQVLKTFGYSLSGGLDMDANSYPDLAVGALRSNAALVLRTRPVVRVNSFVSNANNLQDIDQNIRACRSKLEPNKDSVCFDMEVCFEIVNEKNKLKSQEINGFAPLVYKIVAESNISSLYSRAFFDSTNTNVLNSTLKLKIQRECQLIKVYIRSDNDDFIRPIKFFFSYDFKDNNSPEQSNIPGSLGELNKYPKVHEDFNKYEFEVNFKKECGPDKKCLTDLKLNAEFVNLTIGQDQVPLLSFNESDQVDILVTLDNSGPSAEPAYGTEIFIEYDKRLDFTRQIGAVINLILLNLFGYSEIKDLISFCYIGTKRTDLWHRFKEEAKWPRMQNERVFGTQF